MGEITARQKFWNGSDGNERTLRIPQSSSITGASQTDRLMSYLRHSLEGLAPLLRRSRFILQPQPTGLLKLWDYATVSHTGKNIPIKLLSMYLPSRSDLCLHGGFSFPPTDKIPCIPEALIVAWLLPPASVLGFGERVLLHH